MLLLEVRKLLLETQEEGRISRLFQRLQVMEETKMNAIVRYCVLIACIVTGAFVLAWIVLLWHSGLFFVILLFAPFLFLMIPTLVCYKLTGKWWPKQEEDGPC